MDDGDDTQGDRTVDERPQSARTARDSRPAKPHVTAERYRLGERIGRGGMGEVIAARDEQIGREVAIKRIRTDEPSERAIKRFLREARIQGRLEHPAIVPVHELGRDSDGMPFFAMKRLVGKPLSKIIDDPERDRAKYGRQRLLRAFVDVCLATELAHVTGIIHRDLKPDNIMLGDFGEVYVLDWGVAKIAGEDDDFDDIKNDNLQTSTGVAIGTPGYMSPEQAMGEHIDARTDVYALGITLGEILDADPEPPPELVALRDRATAENREARIQTARSLADEMQRFLDGDRDLELRRKLARDHLEIARAARTATDTVEARRTSMMQAGRALALDPELAEAGQLITQLLVEPPTVAPPEVIAQLEADKRDHARAIYRASMWSSLAYLTIVPGLVETGSLTYWIIAIVAAGTGFYTSLSGTRNPGSMLLTLGANALFAVVLARLYTPVFVAPGVAIALAAGGSGDPRIAGRLGSLKLFVLTSAVVLVPLAAEQLGWLQPTMTMNPDGSLLLHGLAMKGHIPLTPIIVVAVLSVIGIAVLVGHIERESAWAMRRAFHVQAWQVRQLMPDMRRK
ncbi:MAG TPA: serine/threonine-protein kinase [Kofleriaceae bacterium]|nr:serine/threonine-protein kinase [Kofleriaceae bacterium]